MLFDKYREGSYGWYVAEYKRRERARLYAAVLPWVAGGLASTAIFIALGVALGVL